MTAPRELTFLEKLARNEVPRRILGAVLSVPVPGAGHVVIGHPRVGALVAAATLTCFGLAVTGALTVTPPLFLAAGALLILVTVVSVVSVFALPPGPRLKDGLRALWPALALFVLVRGAVYLTGQFAIQIAPVPDDALAPQVRKDDTMLVHPGTNVAVGDVAFVEQPKGSFRYRRVAAVQGDTIELEGDHSVARSDVRGRALFVFAAAREGQGRIWHALHR